MAGHEPDNDRTDAGCWPDSNSGRKDGTEPNAKR